MSDPSGASTQMLRNAAFEKHGRIKTYQAGEEIIGAGGECNDIFFILSGQVRVVNLSSTGKAIWHNTLGPGTTFGEMAALTTMPRNATVVAIEATQIALVTRNEMLALLHADPSIAIWMMTELSNRLHQANEMVRSLVSQSNAQRVRGELVRLARKRGSTNNQMAIEPVPNFSDMARKLNTDRENVSREVSALIAKGVLRKEADRLLVLDLDFLLSTSEL
jgi:CRP/FNR family transcriptional regulator, cyclic AMP receptor protein